jgi:two-component system, sensor histidine kinase and response regulator
MLERAVGDHISNKPEPDDEQRASEILELVFDAAFELDEQAVITAWNARAEKLFGWSDRDVLGKHVQMIVSPRHHEDVLSRLGEAIRLKDKLRTQEPVEVRALRRDGYRFSTELFLCARRRQDGYRLAVFVRNLTDREQLQHLLSQREDQRATLNFIEDAYTELDLQGNHQWVNDAYCRIFNRKREEVLDPSYQNITHYPVGINIRELFKKVYQTGEPVRGFEYEAAPGLFCEITVSLKRGEDGKPTGFVTLIRDTSERKRHEMELAKAKEAADAANRAKSEFLANMSHEIRTPMNGVIGMTELALSTELTEEQREYLSMVRSSAEDLLVIINDVLDYSKIEAGKIDLTLGPLSLSELLGDTMKSLAIAAHRKGLELAFHVDADVPQTLIGDPVRLRQVLVNLAGNAVKFTEKGEVVANASLESRDGSELKVHFAVRDTGIGIAIETQQHLFRPFEQADSSTTKQYGGTGLGLAISKKIVELMGGEIWMESTLREGSTFHFTARLAITEIPEERSFPSSTDLRGIRALIVDDNRTNRRILHEMVARWQMVPQTADSGPAALAKLEAASASGQPFRLILLDEQMPEMDGLEVIGRIRTSSLLRGATILMLTSADQSTSAARCRELGVDTYLIKPIKPSELLAMIHRALAATRTQTIARAPAQKRSAGRSLSILVAEDNAVNQRVAAAMLKSLGHQTTFAGDGIEVVNRWSETRFDLILMDVQMPSIDGFEAARRIRRRELAADTRTPIIAMTARAMNGDRELCIEAGMDDYVSKPVTLEALERALARYAD